MRVFMVVILAGCLHTTVVPCGDNTICPGGKTCETVSATGETLASCPGDCSH